jgi:serine/threonine-protein kinase
MLDERGDVRITDFGIAALAGDVRGAEALAGTPAYMSPEQLEGRELNERSDIYSLGLVLYELFTGKRTFVASSLPELLRLRQSDTQPSSPSSHVKDLDPAVERVILRCLERDPEKRPATALQVAAALPGGDPLAAALAAGETPSPEMVAAAPKEGALRPAVAVSLLASLLVLLAAVCFLSKYVALYRQVPLDKSPEVLRDRAAELVKRLGHDAPAADSAYGMGIDRGYLSYVESTDASRSRWERLRTGQPAAIYFWYRQSPEPFDVWNGGVVSERTPARDTPGMAGLTLDTRGRLRSFYAVPPQLSPTAGDEPAPDWGALFAESGLEQARFRPGPPTLTPPHESTSRAAWEGSYPDQPDLKVRVEAAAFGGMPIYFEIVDAWEETPARGDSSARFTDTALTALLMTAFVTVMVGSALLAWRNLRLGRGDRKGAFRLAAFVFVMFFLRWLFNAHHVLTEDEFFNLLSSVQTTLFWSCFFWAAYVAFEPFVRRRWPHRIISWSRLMAGGFRDPLVGRDLLVGAVFGVAILLCNFSLPDLVLRWLGYPPPVPWFDFPATQLLGIRSAAFGIVQQFFGGLLQSFMLLFLLLLLYIVLRRERLAAIALWVIGALALSLTHESLAGVPFACLTAFLIVWLLYRYGLLALMSAIYFLHLVIFFPITSEFGAWYAGDFVLGLGISLAVAVYGFRVSLGGRKLFRGGLLED